MKQILLKINNTIILLVLSVFLLTGCYDSKELDDLAYVIGIAVDEGSEKQFMFTFQIAVPVKIASEGSEPRKRFFNFNNYRSRFYQFCNIIC